MVGGDQRLCLGSNEDGPESSQDPLSLGWCGFRSEFDTSQVGPCS